MKIPKTLKIGGRDYRVLYPHIFNDSQQALNGQHDADSQLIKVCDVDSFGRKRHPQAVIQAFLHETLHAIDLVYGCGTLGGMSQAGENILEQLSEGLLQVLQDNDLDFRRLT